MTMGTDDGIRRATRRRLPRKYIWIFLILGATCAVIMTALWIHVALAHSKDMVDNLLTISAGVLVSLIGLICGIIAVNMTLENKKRDWKKGEKDGN